MQKSYILILATFLFNLSLSKANNTVDSIGVENNNGKKLILHKVDVKETYYAIAKKYGVNYKDIMTFNDNKLLQIGIIIKVPTQIAFTSNSVVTNSPPTTANQIEYVIKAKDNLNLLAQKFGTTVDEIKRVNNLNSINLQIGQVLKIPNGTTAVEQQIANPIATTTQPKTNTNTPSVTTAQDVITVDHAVKAKENLNVIAENYGTTVAEIKRLNRLSSNNLRIGQTLKVQNVNDISVENVATSVPTPVVTNTPTRVNATPAQMPANVSQKTVGYTHNVLAGETIYSIAKKYGLTTYQIKTANNISEDEVVVGQKIIINKINSVAVNGTADDDSSEDPNTIKDPSLRYPASKYGITQIEEKGTAIWIADQDLDPNKMLVLHRSALIGTIIKVTNPMSNRSAFAKVVGKFTENESTKDVIIVMTKAVADAVGALDKRFYCNINYGAQENEQQ